MSTFSTPTPLKCDASPSHPPLPPSVLAILRFTVLMSDWTEASSEMGVTQNKRYCRTLSCVFPRPYANEQS